MPPGGASSRSRITASGRSSATGFGSSIAEVLSAFVRLPGIAAQVLQLGRGVAGDREDAHVVGRAGVGKQRSGQPEDEAGLVDAVALEDVLARDVAVVADEDRLAVDEDDDRARPACAPSRSPPSRRASSRSSCACRAPRRHRAADGIVVPSDASSAPFSSSYVTSLPRSSVSALPFTAYTLTSFAPAWSDALGDHRAELRLARVRVAARHRRDRAVDARPRDPAARDASR